MGKGFQVQNIVWAYFKMLSNEQLYVMLSSRSLLLRGSAVRELHLRPSLDVFNKSLSMIKSKSAKERSLGYDIISQLGAPLRPYRDEVSQLIVENLENEKNVKVLEHIFYTLGHNQIPIDSQDFIIQKIKALISSAINNSLLISIAFSISSLHPTENLYSTVEFMKTKFCDDKEVVEWLEVAEDIFRMKS